MLRYLKIILFIALAIAGRQVWCATDARFAAAVCSPVQGHHTITSAGNDTTERELVNGSFHPDEAARINRRYHERLAMLFSPVLPAVAYARPPTVALHKKIVYGIAYNSICLSSCYSYLFRLSPF